MRLAPTIRLLTQVQTSMPFRTDLLFANILFKLSHNSPGRTRLPIFGTAQVYIYRFATINAAQHKSVNCLRELFDKIPLYTELLLELRRANIDQRFYPTKADTVVTPVHSCDFL